MGHDSGSSLRRSVHILITIEIFIHRPGIQLVDYQANKTASQKCGLEQAMQFYYLAETCRCVVFKCPYKNKSAVTVPWDSDDIRPRTVLLSGFR